MMTRFEVQSFVATAIFLLFVWSLPPGQAFLVQRPNILSSTQYSPFGSFSSFRLAVPKNHQPLSLPNYPEDFFLHQVETTISNVLSKYKDCTDVLELPCEEREPVVIARKLDRRLNNLRRNNDCPRCWMQRAHCICSECPPVTFHYNEDNSNNNSNNDDNKNVRHKIRRIFLLMHHKEIALKVDTAKLIMAAFPQQCRLVVAGIGGEFQESMRELEESTRAGNNQRCLVLFPDEDARTFEEISKQIKHVSSDDVINSNFNNDSNDDIFWDVVVLDGTWAQARKMYSRYLPAWNNDDNKNDDQGATNNRGPRRVQLSDSAVASLQNGSTDSGHQLRRHDIAWRQVGTFEATRLFLKDVMMSQTQPYNNNQDMSTFQTLKSYQVIANKAAIKELGPPRLKEEK